MDIPITIIKATGLSSIIFWSIIFTEVFNTDMFLFVIVSFIPIIICCALTIWLTIAPFFWLKKAGTNLKTIRNRYFPFYSIMLFALSAFASIGSEFDIYVMAFVISAFFTALKSWSWIIESDKKTI